MSGIIIKNSLKRKLKEGKVAIGLTVLEWTRPSLSKIAKQAGFDFLFLEYEHTYFNEESMAGIILLGREIDLPVCCKSAFITSPSYLSGVRCRGVRGPASANGNIG